MVLILLWFVDLMIAYLVYCLVCGFAMMGFLLELLCWLVVWVFGFGLVKLRLVFVCD